jgi:threonine/homoserine/homoserine lactone efflux protein
VHAVIAGALRMVATEVAPTKIVELSEHLSQVARRIDGFTGAIFVAFGLHLILARRT